MKHLKTFQQLNEGLDQSPNLQKSFDENVKLIDDVSKAIVNAKEFKERLESMKKNSPEVYKSFKGYFELAEKAQKSIKKIKSKGLSKNKDEAKKQVDALSGFADSLRAGFKNLKEVNDKTKKAFKNNEGLGNIVGNTLRNILTGKWIVNILKSVKSNLMDTRNEYETVQDMFDIKDY